MEAGQESRHATPVARDRHTSNDRYAPQADAAYQLRLMRMNANRYERLGLAQKACLVSGAFKASFRVARLSSRCARVMLEPRLLATTVASRVCSSKAT